tara:strand:- start:44 stop:247 length:204 start_codon:yes stop_codon:yes gene_type:complete
MDPISAVTQVLSQFTRTTITSNGVETALISYIKQGGATRVEEVSFTTYDNKGKLAEHNTANKVDITV